ncbi:hypothetical protein [Ruania zhangjianzhongii]|nr:hypothetical protein [Ruania zhangjianzhongii]
MAQWRTEYPRPDEELIAGLAQAAFGSAGESEETGPLAERVAARLRSS